MAIEIGEEVAVSTGLRAFMVQGLSVAATLVSLIFGHKPSTQEVVNQQGPFISFLAGPVHAMDNLFHATRGCLEQVYNRFQAAARTVSKWVANEAVSRHYAVQRVETEASHWVANEAVTRHYAVQRVESEASRWVANEAVTRHNAVVTAEARAAAQANQVRQTAAIWVQEEAAARHNAVVAAQAAAEHTAAAYVAQEAVQRHDALVRTQATIEQETIQPTRATWPQLVTEIDGATEATGGQMPELAALLQAVPRTGAATLGEAATDPLAIQRALLRALTDCVIPNCRNLSQAGRDLTSLFGLVEGAALLAFLAEIIHDPETAARDTVDILDPVFSATLGGFVDLVGGL